MMFSSVLELEFLSRVHNRKQKDGVVLSYKNICSQLFVIKGLLLSIYVPCSFPTESNGKHMDKK